MALGEVRFFQGWLNNAAVKYGGKQIDGLSKECVTNTLSIHGSRFFDDGLTLLQSPSDKRDMDAGPVRLAWRVIHQYR